jgi:EAL domain-containing protein (putative c-di-GMP-specific phosphodiesterase class I)
MGPAEASLGCRLGQGFYFSPAVAPEVIPHLNFTHLA